MTERLNTEEVARRIARVEGRYLWAYHSDSDVGDLTAWYMEDVPLLIAEIERLRVEARDRSSEDVRREDG